MKTFTLTLFAIAITSLALGSDEDEPFIYLKPTDTMYVQVIDYVGLDTVGSEDRFYRIKQTFDEILSEVDFPIEYEIKRFGSWRVPEGQPRLDLTIMKWGSNGMSEIEARFIASLKRDYERNKLGVFQYRGGMLAGTSEQLTRTYNDVLRKALAKLVSELNDHFIIMDPMTHDDLEVNEALNEGLNAE